jgi:hypothetical protein
LSAEQSELDEEIESWKGFPYVLRKNDLEVWDEMIKGVREQFAGAVENSGRTFATEPFLMALLLLQQKMIKRLKAELEAAGVDLSGSPTFNAVLDRR